MNAPSKIRFSTDIYPEAERFDAWREEFVHRVIDSDVARIGDAADDPFYAATEVMHIGDIRFAHTVRSPTCMSRTARHAAQGDSSLCLMINRKGALRAAQDGVEVTQDRPGALIINHDRIHDVQCLSRKAAAPDGPEMAHIFAFNLPRRILLSVAPEALARRGGPLDCNPALLEYLLQYMADFIVPGGDDPALRGAMADHLLDLIALMLGPSRDAAEIASRRGLRAARLKSILSFVAENISDPALDVAMVATRHGIGTRYVSQLMEEKGETLTRLILRLRLEKAAAMLTDPAFAGRRIGDVAQACGFSDLSHFNRAFRARFGETPRAYRR